MGDEFIRAVSLPSCGPLRERFDIIRSRFKEIYGNEPAFLGRAPGRVNLIGEHIDYCGYAVLPMAVEQDIVIAVAENDRNQLRLANTDQQYPPHEIDTVEYHIDKTNPRWQHYFLCGYRGILEHFGLSGSKGFDILLDGTIPCSAGLSSSSALVCCAALVAMKVFGKDIPKAELAELCQHCERFIGTEGGGMDQAISFLARRGSAKLIEFNPIRATDVTLPNGAVFVISNSCVEMNKAATDHFNIRVAECRLAAQICAKKNGLDWMNVRRLGDVQTSLGLTLEDVIQLVEKTFHVEPYTKQEICDILEVTSDRLDEISLSERSRNVQEFKLHDRALHVYSEANRVLKFKAICDQQPPGALELLGNLMFESHESCRDLYQCSCTELDEVVELAKKSGALGSRLTGAGWGGCAVSLVPADQVDQFLEKMNKGYYACCPKRSIRVAKCLFATEPGDGATLYLL